MLLKLHHFRFVFTLFSEIDFKGNVCYSIYSGNVYLLEFFLRVKGCYHMFKRSISLCLALALLTSMSTFAANAVTENPQTEVAPSQVDSVEATGDVNDDGSFDVADVVLLQKWLLSCELESCKLLR